MFSIKKLVLPLVLMAGLSFSTANATEKEIYIPGSAEIATVEVSDVKVPVVIYYNGDILTMDGDKPQYVEAVAQKDGKIDFVGSKTDALKKYGKNVRLIDLKGNTMLPGFIDPHSHFMSSVAMVNQINVAAPPVGTATNIPQIIEKLKGFSDERHIAEDGWIIGWGYDQDLIDEKRHVTKKDLDAAFPNRKVMIIHVSMHGAVLNSKALAWANIDDKTETPAGGVIARFPGTTEPAGLVMETAYMPIFAKLPSPSETDMLELMKPAQMMYASNGYTQAVEGFTHAKDLRFLQKAAKENRIFLDLLALPAFTELEDVLGHPKEFIFGEYNNHLKLQAVKITIDGSPQAKTALVREAYLTGGPNGEKNWKGDSSLTQEELDTLTKKIFDMKIPLHIHCNGGGAVDMMVKTVKKAGITAKDDRRTLIVHSQFMWPDQLDSYVELGLTPSFFTLHTYYWGDVHVKNIGEKRASFLDPMKAAVDKGLKVSNHTDFNVTPLDPFWVMSSAVNRISRSGKVIGPDQRVDTYTALQAMTTGPAWQVFEENRKGKIKEGMLADFVVIKNNPLKQKVEALKENEVLATVKEGKVIFKKIGI